jgi:hypothetical protein
MVKKLVFLLLLASCTMTESGMRPSTGAVNELLIITNDKAQWEGELGDTLRAFFAGEMIGLSQPEPIFDIINIADENFTDIFQKYHNILMVDINPAATAPASETKQNVWSEPQRIIQITAPDLASFYTEFNLKKENFLQIFIDLERQRTLKISKLDMDYKLTETVNSKFGISLPFPEGFYVAKEAPDFMWLRYTLAKTKQDVEIGVMIYTMDYKDAVVFDPRHIIKWRNMISMQHIPGPSPLSYMTTSTEVFPPVFDTITNFPGGYAVETRGLWEVVNDFMGGPFINYTFIDKAHNTVITLDGYVYNPNDDKKNFLRQLESVFFALKFSQPQ